MEDKFCINSVRDALHEGVLEIVFTKKDGSERTIKCSTRPDLIADTINDNTPSHLNKDPDLFRVTDLELDEWRSFRFDQIISVKTL